VAPAKLFFRICKSVPVLKQTRNVSLEALVPAPAKETCESHRRPDNPLKNLTFLGASNRVPI
jgi:hypothetical protein